jgi:hypothetical protein
LIRLLEESKFDSREYSPYEVFKKSLYEYYSEEIELDVAEKQPPGSSLVPLANVQEFAYKKGLQISACRYVEFCSRLDANSLLWRGHDPSMIKSPLWRIYRQTNNGGGCTQPLLASRNWRRGSG